MEIPELKHQRDRIMSLLGVYARKKYDGTLLAKEYKRLTDLGRTMGLNLSTNRDYLKEAYWENQFNKSREHLNKNPIKCIEGNEIIWEKFQPNQLKTNTKQQKQPTKLNQSPVKPLTNIQSQQSSNYFLLNIVGLNSEQDIVNNFSSDIGLKRIDQSSYQYRGTESEFNIIKRAVMSLIDNLIPNNNISVYGKKIFNKLV